MDVQPDSRWTNSWLVCQVIVILIGVYGFFFGAHTYLA
jgi:hypothetical protein